MFDYTQLSPKESITLATVIAILISEGLSIDEQNFLGNFLTLIAQGILTIAAQAEAIEDKKNKNSTSVKTEEST